mgnify:FL=1
MVNILSGSVSAYRQESANQRFIRIDEVMDPLQMRMAVCMNCVRPLYQTTRYEKTIRRFCSTISRVESMQCIILRECRSFCYGISGDFLQMAV